VAQQYDKKLSQAFEEASSQVRKQWRGLSYDTSLGLPLPLSFKTSPDPGWGRMNFVLLQEGGKFYMTDR